MYRAAAASVCVVGMLMLTGCAVFGPQVPTEGPIAVYPRPDAGMDALLEGTLRITDECVWVEAYGRDVVVVFPAGDASVDDHRLTYLDREYVDGDDISLGGGHVTGAFGDDVYVPQGCGVLEEPFLVSPVW